jgi:hypothetical protein
MEMPQGINELGLSEELNSVCLRSKKKSVMATKGKEKNVVWLERQEEPRFTAPWRQETES